MRMQRAELLHTMEWLIFIPMSCTKAQNNDSAERELRPWSDASLSASLAGYAAPIPPR